MIAKAFAKADTLLVTGFSYAPENMQLLPLVALRLSTKVILDRKGVKNPRFEPVKSLFQKWESRGAGRYIVEGDTREIIEDMIA